MAPSRLLIPGYYCVRSLLEGQADRIRLVGIPQLSFGIGVMVPKSWPVGNAAYAHLMEAFDAAYHLWTRLKYLRSGGG